MAEGGSTCCRPKAAVHRPCKTALYTYMQSYACITIVCPFPVREACNAALIDASCRHLADPATKTIAELRPALIGTQLLTMLAHFEPACFGACRVDLSHWPKILGALMPIVTKISVLESLLEGKL